jgi:hypothetical protein
VIDVERSPTGPRVAVTVVTRARAAAIADDDLVARREAHRRAQRERRAAWRRRGEARWQHGGIADAIAENDTIGHVGCTAAGDHDAIGRVIAVKSPVTGHAARARAAVTIPAPAIRDVDGQSRERELRDLLRFGVALRVSTCRFRGNHHAMHGEHRHERDHHADHHLDQAEPCRPAAEPMDAAPLVHQRPPTAAEAEYLCGAASPGNSHWTVTSAIRLVTDGPVVTSTSGAYRTAVTPGRRCAWRDQRAVTGATGTHIELRVQSRAVSGLHARQRGMDHVAGLRHESARR